MSRSCLLLVVSALAMLAVCVQATDNEMNVFTYNSNPDCLGPVDSYISWPPVSSTSDPNCTVYQSSGESQQYYVASDSATCSLLGEAFHANFYRTETCSEDQPAFSRSYTSGCSEMLMTREEKAKRMGVTWGPSQAFSCLGDPMLRPYVSVHVSGPCPIGPAQPAKRAFGDYTAIFSNAAANECFQYYNATQEANQYVKLTNGVCNPALGTVSFSIYSDETCATLVEEYTEVPLSSCTPVEQGAASVTITCVAPASTPTPSTPGMVPPPPSKPPTSAATQLAIASLVIIASFVALLL